MTSTMRVQLKGGPQFASMLQAKPGTSMVSNGRTRLYSILHVISVFDRGRGSKDPKILRTSFMVPFAGQESGSHHGNAVRGATAAVN